MATFYYIKDKECTLVNRNTGVNSKFVLEAPNGDGVFDAEIKEINGDGSYVDADGILRKGYQEYEIIATFYYSSHTMNLANLLDADEIIIPFSLGISKEVDTKFVLLNREAIYNYFAEQPFISTKNNEDYPYGSIELEFATIEPMTFEDILSMSYYTEDGLCDLEITSITVTEV